MRLAAVLCAGLWLAACAAAQNEASPQGAPDMSVRGAFAVEMTPVDGAMPPRFQLAKTYEGPLSGTGTGEMMTAMTATEGSAAYVAIETVDGTLEGKPGTFALVHRGIMDRGAQSLSVTVVPDSATGDLAGLSGEMDIQIEADGSHFYIFDYKLP